MHLLLIFFNLIFLGLCVENDESSKILQVGCGTVPINNYLRTNERKQSKIVGGYEAIPHSFPWQVVVYDDYKFYCGGSIISDRWVLTAAHCVYTATSVQVLMGAHNISEAEPTQILMSTFDFTVHEEWDPRTLHNDIAVIHLPEKVFFNDYIQPICLPSITDLEISTGEPVVMTGWGFYDENIAVNSDVLLEVNSTILDHNICASNFFGGNFTVTEANVCTDGTGGIGVCHGDSGGPLNYNPTGNKTFIRGIVSFGSSTCSGGGPDVYSSTLYYLSWIQDNTDITTI